MNDKKDTERNESMTKASFASNLLGKKNKIKNKISPLNKILIWFLDREYWEDGLEKNAGSYDTKRRANVI